MAEERHKFLWHLGWYVAVNLGLVLLWVLTGLPNVVFFWPVFPLIFWGFFVVVHYLSAYRKVGRGWVARETEKILREEEGRGP
ncbi:MAG: 2TM domain-containing protein [Candidatus Thermoplasmatota archaeon]|nr:2TM domain-containing protein [Candidatus Thermoplasmatota archaeon]